MNTITIHGKILTTPEILLITTKENIQIPLVKFLLKDSAFGYQQQESIIEINFMKEAASNIFNYLKKGKEVVIIGCLRSKTYKTNEGIEKQKYYISADHIILTGSGYKGKAS